MEKFPHLQFLQKVVGKPNSRQLKRKPNPVTQNNKSNKQGHYDFLSESTNDVKSAWETEILERQSQNLPHLDNKIIPVFLQINPSLIGFNFDLKSYGIEIISQEDNGFIIGASMDGFNSLDDKINKFLNNIDGGGSIADLWQIIKGRNWKPEFILSDYLLSIWKTIIDNDVFTLEVGIAFDKPLGNLPDSSKKGGVARLKKYREKEIDRDNRMLERQDQFSSFIENYGTVKTSFIELEDSFCCQIEISGKGFKDLVFNYPFVFEISETEDILGISSVEEQSFSVDIKLIEPNKDSPIVGIIDSGLMEEHKYIAPAIISNESRSYVIGDSSTADYVKGGGHGTRVAGAVLYPNGMPISEEPYQLPCFIRNIRVLDKDNRLLNRLPAELMQEIVEDNKDCKIFNLSINSSVPYRLKHMSSWASTIDTLMNQENIIFIISAGNIHIQDIRNHLNSDASYPSYLDKSNSRLANPAQSSFAITVGSVNSTDFEDENWKSLGGQNEISAFSRVGTGIWGMIKPDVVEFGGGLIVSKTDFKTVRNNESTSPELVRSTLNGGGAYGKDIVGTSFATPKVSYIIAELSKIYPDENINLLRGLVVQGARLPNDFFYNPTLNSIRYFGYGIPSLERVTKNTNQRITFYNTGSIKADEGQIYSLRIPESLRNQADEHNILIEVSLSYTAKVRRTRQMTRSYMATSLDWTSSKLGQSLNDFEKVVLKQIEEGQAENDNENNDTQVIKWKIRERKDWGVVKDINRSNSTLQKDWAIIKSYDLPEEISFAVIGHRGWDKSNEIIPYALVVSIEILDSNIEIYEAIRIENPIEIEI
jgi:Subtilase family